MSGYSLKNIMFKYSFFHLIAMSISTPVIFIIAVMFASMFVLLVLANTINVMAQPIINSSESKKVTTKLNVTDATGSIASLQNDESGKPAWIVSGKWNMKSNPSQVNQTIFNASFGMVKTDGTSRHKHNITDFKLRGNPINNNMSATFNGTTTITLKDGPHKDIPTSIKIMDTGAISILVDATKTNKHFGNTPIYGNVWRTHRK
jgi:hypothetical protein